MNKQTCIIYARVSTEEQKKKGLSVPGQIRDCTEYAKRMGYKVINTFADEGVSAKDLNRADLQRMFKYIKNNGKNIDAIIFWKWDRLSRGEDIDNITLARLFGKYDITPLSILENNETTPIANLMRRKAEAGHFPAKAPIGYLNKRDEHDTGYIDVDEAIAPLVQRIFKYYASGMYSLDSLGQQMYTEGFKDKFGKPYRARKFEEILKNVFYMGDFMWAGKRYTGKHKALVSKKLFYLVQDKFKKTDKPVKNDKNFIYNRFITCAKCGCYLTAENKPGGHNSGKYTYYHCTNKKKMHPSMKGMNITEEAINIEVQDIINAIEIPDSVVRRLKDKIITSLDELYVVENQLIDLLINKSYEDKVKGILSEEDYLKYTTDWKQERDLLAIDIKDSGDINHSIYKNIDLIIDFCNRIPNLFINADLDTKRLMLRMLIDEIQYEYTNKELTVKLKPVFEALRLIKLYGNHENESEKVRTLKKPLNREVLEYLNEQIALIVNSKVRTLETRIIPNKKAPEGANLLNGADDGIRTHA